MSDLRAAAEAQLIREFSARRSFARGCGAALLELSSILEDSDARLDRAVDPLGVVLVAWAVRGRRLLRAAYRLLDVGDAPEAVPLIRILIEYAIVGRWLKMNPDRLHAWAMKDHGKREHTLREVIAELGDVPDAQAALQEQLNELEKMRERWRTERGEPSGGVPKIEVMASEIGAGFGYQLGYRTQSQSDVHATPLSVDVVYGRLDDGTLRILPVPGHALGEYDQYELAALALRDLLATVAEHMPALMWRSGIEGITAALIAARDSDPRKHEDPARALHEEAEDTDET